MWRQLAKLIFCSFIVLASSAFANEISTHYVKVSDDLTMFYRETGQGSTLLFVPGWTASSAVYQAQLEYFGKSYHVIAIDPRSQGNSSITLENNTYTQHGTDLAHFIEKLNLKNIVLIGWSWGCYDAYAYIRQQGTGNLKGFVCIDVMPKTIGKKGEWAYVDYPELGSALFQPLMYHRYDYTAALLQSMVTNKLSPEKFAFLMTDMLRTPTYAALELATDAFYADYRPEAILLDRNNIPTLNYVSERNYPAAKKWLQKNAPHSAIAVEAKHMTFWEEPDIFNPKLGEFLNKLD